MAGFALYGEAGQGRYSDDNAKSHSIAEVAVAYVIKALGKKGEIDAFCNE